MGWLPFILALAAFFAVHWIVARPAVRDGGRARLGRRGYGMLVGLAELAALVLVIWAAAEAPYVPLWDSPLEWQRWLANLAMPVAVLLLVLALGAPNPLSFGGRTQRFDPDRPGIAGVVRHPILWALLIWSTVHLLANGDVAHVLLFGGFAVFSVLGMRILDRRRRRDLGADWARLAARTSNLPFAGGAGRWFPSPLRLVIAAATWIALLWLHPDVIGVSPLP